MPLVFKFGHDLRTASDRGGSVLGLARLAGLPVGAACGGRGTCGRCSVFLASGDFEICGQRVTVVPGERREALACETKHIGGDAEILLVPLNPEDDDGARIDAEIILPPHEHRPVVARNPLAVAIDIGTSTVAVALVNPTAGRVLGRATRFNRQMLCGDDVAARITFGSDAAGLKTLRDLIVEHTIQPMIEELCLAQDIPVDAVGAAAVCGNTVMMHLFLGLSPARIGVWPFRPVASEFTGLTAGSVGLNIQPDAPVFVAPAISGYVGGDIVADLAVCGLGRSPGLELLIDIGTNGEMVLAQDGQLVACATAAGPAFEGAGLVHGCRAVRGAIERIEFAADLSLTWRTIGDAPPIGLCGSAAIDFIACASEVGLLNEFGRFDLDLLRRSGRFVRFETQGHALHACVVVPASESGTGDALVVTEADIAQVLKAKAAMYAGAQTLVRGQGRELRSLDRLVLAGGFAKHLRLDRAIRLGLLPDIPLDRIDVIGNGSLGGAVLALFDRETQTTFSELIHRVDVVELNLDPAFADRFADAMAIPHLDAAEFPSVQPREKTA